MNILLGVSFILGAISMSAQAGYSSSDEPAKIYKYECGVVEGKKPWCACRSSISKDIIDLSSLGRNLEAAMIRDPKFRSNIKQGWQVAWTPCEDFNMFTNITLNPDIGEKACKGVGFARYTEVSAKICNGYGSHETSAKFYSNGHDSKTGEEQFYIEYLYPVAAPQRTARIWLFCNEKNDEGTLEYFGDQHGIEVAHFTSKCCCQNQLCKSKPYKLGAGAIAGISVAAFIVTIAVATAIYKWKHRSSHPVQEGVAQEHEERLPIL